jgi:hypothetical protein
MDVPELLTVREWQHFSRFHLIQSPADSETFQA